MERAQEAVNCLEVKIIQDLKALTTPPAACVDVTKAVLILLKGEKKNYQWPNAQKMMNNPKKFLEDVQAFNANEIDEWKLEALVPVLSLDYFNKDDMLKKSQAAGYMCGWVINIVEYNRIYKKVKPLDDAAKLAQSKAEQKGQELAVVKEKVRLIEE
jgi:dynein heavy chain